MTCGSLIWEGSFGSLNLRVNYQWELLFRSEQGGRSSHVAVVDGNRMIIHGGYNSGGALGDVMAFDFGESFTVN